MVLSPEYTAGRNQCGANDRNEISAVVNRRPFGSILAFIRVIRGAKCFRLWLRSSGKSEIKVNFKKDVDILLASQIASLLPLRVHRRGKLLHFIHEKEIYFTISLL